MNQQEKAQIFLHEYNELTRKHGLALRPVLKPSFDIIVLEGSDKIDSKAPETTQADTGVAPSDSEKPKRI